VYASVTVLHHTIFGWFSLYAKFVGVQLHFPQCRKNEGKDCRRAREPTDDPHCESPIHIHHRPKYGCLQFGETRNKPLTPKPIAPTNFRSDGILRVDFGELLAARRDLALASDRTQTDPTVRSSTRFLGEKKINVEKEDVHNRNFQTHTHTHTAAAQIHILLDARPQSV
jgi:hypothetical protein